MIIGEDKNAALIERSVEMLCNKLSYSVIAVEEQAVRASRNASEHSPYYGCRQRVGSVSARKRRKE